MPSQKQGVFDAVTAAGRLVTSLPTKRRQTGDESKQQGDFSYLNSSRVSSDAFVDAGLSMSSRSGVTSDTTFPEARSLFGQSTSRSFAPAETPVLAQNFPFQNVRGQLTAEEAEAVLIMWHYIFIMPGTCVIGEERKSIRTIRLIEAYTIEEPPYSTYTLCSTEKLGGIDISGNRKPPGKDRKPLQFHRQTTNAYLVTSWLVYVAPACGCYREVLNIFIVHPPTYEKVELE
ncbi:hypothetical protein C8R44DRAFT_744604 [Mycena epipterygia]|nr:hypothetical protein C8R44DRAFT_744604 [Mycena epipterygia]